MNPVPTPDPNDVDMGRHQRGHDGVALLGGWSQNESNPRLDPRSWFGAWGYPGILDDMVRTDVAVQIGVAGLTLNLNSVPRTFQPASEERHHKVHAAFLNDAMKKHPGGRAPWLIAQAARHAWGGVALIEHWYEYDPDYELVVDGQVVMQGALLPRFAPIMPWAVDRWRSDGAMLLSPAIGDVASASSGAVLLEPDEFIHLRHMPLGSDPTPYGMLRPAHPDYLLCKKIKLWLSIGFERSAVPTPVLNEDKDANISPQERAKARSLGKNMRSSAKGYAYLPDGIRLSFADWKFRAKDLIDAHGVFQRKILQAMFMQAVEGGISGIGSYASISGHLSLATSLVRSIDEEIVGCFDPIWDATIRANFTDHRGAMPVWHHPEIAIESSLQEWANAAKTLKDAGFFTPTAADGRIATRRLQLAPREVDEEFAGEPSEEGNDGEA